jgi:ribosomal protein L11 methyltransferase
VRAFVVTTGEDDVDLPSDVLWQLGVRAIEERSVPGEPGSVELWTAVGDDDASIARAVDRLAGRWPSRVVDVDDVSAETWRDHARPVVVDDVVTVVPAWQTPPPDAAVVTIAIEPLGAFGLGDHPTTLLSLRAVRPLIEPGCDLLDVGCGTGVIAVTAARLGAGAVRAVDIASAAVEATRANAARNGVQVEVDTTPLASIEGTYDVVVANILAPVLVELAADLRRRTRTGGRLIVSGILDGAHDHVIAALGPMVVERTDVLDGWAAVTLRHP